MLQIVVDTNVVIAAFRSRRGAANLFLSNLADERWQINVSTPLLLEYEDVLKRAGMNAFISAEDADVFLDGLCSISSYHEIFYLWRLLAKDPNDAFLLELAVRVSADFIITYNTKDFPAAASFNIKLMTPKQFLEFMGDL